MCKNRPWRECCNDCKELEFFRYICKDMVKVKNYIVHLGDHYDDPRLYLTCSIYGLIEILLHVDLGMQNVDYMFITYSYWYVFGYYILIINKGDVDNKSFYIGSYKTFFSDVFVHL